MNPSLPTSPIDFWIAAIALVITAFAAVLTGRTAKSKGYSFGLFFGLSFISWFVVATVAIFIKPRKSLPVAASPEVAAKNAAARKFYYFGIASYVVGLGLMVASWGNDSVDEGAIFLLAGPILILTSIALLITAVLAAKNPDIETLSDFEIS